MPDHADDVQQGHARAADKASGPRLVLIETAGNQRYIFATNKLRECLGASQAIHSVGHEVPIEGSQQPILQTSGKAMVLCESAADARALISTVTRQALAGKPGLDVRGVHVRAPPPDAMAAEFHQAVLTAYERMEEARILWPGPESRFLSLPPIARCATSGLPAECFDRKRPDPAARSAAARAKRDAMPAGRARMQKYFHGKLKFPDDPDDLQKNLSESWLGVVHADINDLGAVFRDLGSITDGKDGGAATGQDYIHQMREFSSGVDRAVSEALTAAIEIASNHWLMLNKDKKDPETLPVLPIVVGGDDLTVLCDGRLALPLAHAFLTAFEEKSQEGVVGEIAKVRNKSGGAGLTACAGVAIVKSHYPFHAAYDMAEWLTKSAKRVKGLSAACSALDFHLHYDAGGNDVGAIRRHWRQKGAAGGLDRVLTGRPYVVTPRDTLELLLEEDDRRAVEPHHWDSLMNAAHACRPARDEDDAPGLGNSQLHVLRADLFVATTEEEPDDPTPADRRLNLLLRRAGTNGKTPTALVDGELIRKVRPAGAGTNKAERPGTAEDREGYRLFFHSDLPDLKGKREAVRFTRLIDAIDVVSLEPGNTGDGS